MNLLIATRNRHKVDEIKAILGEQHRYFTLAEFPTAPVVEEDAETFEGNATKKAVVIAEWLRKTQPGIDYVLADDSGLEVDALNGAPGVHSARFAARDRGHAGNSSDQENNDKLLKLLHAHSGSHREARFRCVIAFAPVPEKCAENASSVCSASEVELQTQLFQGVCEGHILEQSRGLKGFGYDPLFVPNSFSETFAELGDEKKNQISHRSRALAKLKEYLGRKNELKG